MFPSTINASLRGADAASGAQKSSKYSSACSRLWLGAAAAFPAYVPLKPFLGKRSAACAMP